MKFSVWAPMAHEVRLQLENAEHAMHRDHDGWWSVEQPAVSGETRYRYIVDGGPPVPDPRSRWQPDGVHGPSCVWDTAALAARERTPFVPAPLTRAVIYEAHVGTFTPEGTYRAARSRLGHLRDLGITHLELMPLATFPGERGWGYDGVYLYAPHPAYGTPDELANLIEDCHRHGIAVLLDVVYNHLGPDGNYLGVFGPYFTAHWKTPWGDAVNFDGPESDHVRAFVIENALMWLRDYRFDGLRIDAVQAMIDSRARHVLEEMGERVAILGRESGRELLLMGESDRNDPRYVRSPEWGGYGLHAHWADDFHHAVHAYFTGETGGYHGDYGSLGDIVAALQQGYVYTGQYSKFRRHSHGRPPRGVRPEQLVVCTQNHDQVGNRALGDRMSMLVPPEALRAMAALTILGPFTPLLFQGEEWAARTPFLYFTDHHEPELARAVTEGRRREFAAFRWEAESVPDPQDRNVFMHAKLRWAELEEAPHREMLGWYRALIALRRERGVEDRWDREASADETARWLTYRIGRLLVVLNLAPHPQAVPTIEGQATRLLGPEEVRTPADRMPPHSTCVWRLG